MVNQIEDITADLWSLQPQECLSFVKSNMDKIPVLGCDPLHLLKDAQLVQFRGMVQDMPNPVMYSTHYEIVHTETGRTETRTGKYKEHFDCETHEEISKECDFTKSDERRPYLCVSIPGLNEWAELKSDLPLIDNSKQSTSSGTGSKRTADSMEDEEILGATKKPFEVPESSTASTTEQPSAGVQPPTDAHFPLPSPNNKACLVTLYDISDGEIKLNEVIHAVGFVYLSPTYEDAENLPSSLLPRLHAVHYEKVIHTNPLVNKIDSECIFSEAEKIRTDLHLGLSQMLMGDTLAADYFICYLLSSVYSRQDLMAIGKYSLNISSAPLSDKFTEGVYNIVKHLVPKSHYIPMSLENMNSSSFLPAKDYTTNRLKSGTLQLSDLTHLIIDETKLQTGKLQSQGVLNVQTLNALLTSQKLDYDFKYYTVPFNTNYPILVLSEGKSMLPCDSQLVLKPDENKAGCFPDVLEAVENYFQEPHISKIRSYISIVSREEFSFSDELQRQIQNDFVDMRKENSKVTADDLHSLLVLARLVSLSHGHKSLSKDVWEEVKNMEAERKSRLTAR